MGVGSDDSSSLRTCVMVCLAVSLGAVSVWLLNVTAYPSFNDFFPGARDVATTFSGICALLFSVIAARKPLLFTGIATFVVGMTMTVLGSAGMFLGSWLQSAVLASLFGCLRSVGALVCFAYMSLALMRLGPQRCVTVLVCAYLVKYVFVGLLMLAPPVVLVVAFVLTQAAEMALIYACARESLVVLRRTGSQADLSVTNPLSFLPPTSGLFVTILLFQAALGFAITYGSVESFPQPIILAVVAVAGLAIVTLVRRGISLDVLYSMAFVLVLAGLLMVPTIQIGMLGSGSLGTLVGSASNALLQAGSEIINIAVWLLAAAIGRRNLAGALPTAFVISGVGGIGVEIGAASGNLQNALSASHPELAVLFPIAIAFAFAVYNFFLARSFSFDATVRGLQPIAPVKELDERDGDRGSRVDRRCRELTEASRLTERESQVLALLARGRNAAYIQESLSLSRNTIKSYVARVYGKLGVHSHQEVIDLVEQGLEADGR